MNASPHLDDVSVVELVLQRYDLPHEAQRAELQERVAGLQQHQNFPKKQDLPL